MAPSPLPRLRGQGAGMEGGSHVGQQLAGAVRMLEEMEHVGRPAKLGTEHGAVEWRNEELVQVR